MSMGIIKFILKTSIIKTLIFNIRYFKMKGLIPYVLISRNIKLKKLGGKIIYMSNKRCKCHIGYAYNYIYSGSNLTGTFYNLGTIIINGNLCISKGSNIVVKENGTLVFGNNVHISQHTSIEAHKKIVFGNNSVISWDCLIMDSDTHPIYRNGTLENPNKPIILGENTWICCKCIILKGTNIANNSIVGASSICTIDSRIENAILLSNKTIKTNINFDCSKDIDKI